MLPLLPSETQKCHLNSNVLLHIRGWERRGNNHPQKENSEYKAKFCPVPSAGNGTQGQLFHSHSQAKIGEARRQSRNVKYSFSTNIFPIIYILEIQLTERSFGFQVPIVTKCKWVFSWLSYKQISFDSKDSQVYYNQISLLRSQYILKEAKRHSAGKE